MFFLSRLILTTTLSLVAAVGSAASTPNRAIVVSHRAPGPSVSRVAAVGGAERVLALSQLVSSTRIRLTTDDETIETTPEHRFFVRGHGWVRAMDLHVGARLDGVVKRDSATLLDVEAVAGPPRQVFNLLVERAHTFRVGHSGVLVHNGSCVVAPSVGPALQGARARTPGGAALGRRLSLDVRSAREPAPPKSPAVAARRANAERTTVTPIAPDDPEYRGALRAGEVYQRGGWYTFVAHRTDRGILVEQQFAGTPPLRAFLTLAQRRANDTVKLPASDGRFKNLSAIGKLPRDAERANYQLGDIDHRAVAKMLKKKGQTNESILLASCNAGEECERPFAQNLANKLNSEVLAPSTSLRTDGRPFVPEYGGVWRLFRPHRSRDAPSNVDSFVMRPGHRPLQGNGAYLQRCILPDTGSQDCFATMWE